MSRGRVSGSAPAQLIMASGWKFWTWRRIMPRSSSGHCQRVVAATVWPAPQAAATTRLPSIPPAPVTQSFIGGRPHKQGTQVRNRPRPCNDTGRFRVSFPLPEYPLVVLSADGPHHPLVRVLDRLVDVGVVLELLWHLPHRPIRLLHLVVSKDVLHTVAADVGVSGTLKLRLLLAQLLAVPALGDDRDGAWHQTLSRSATIRCQGAPSEIRILFDGKKPDILTCGAERYRCVPSFVQSRLAGDYAVATIRFHVDREFLPDVTRCGEGAGFDSNGDESEDARTA